MKNLKENEIIIKLGEIEEYLDTKYHISSVIHLHKDVVLVNYYSSIISGVMSFRTRILEIFYSWDVERIGDIIETEFQLNIIRKIFPDEIIT